MAITYRISKFRKKHIRSPCFTYHMTKHNICYIFHWCQNKKRRREVIPKITYHIKIRILSLKYYRIRLPYKVQSYLEIVYINILKKNCHKIKKFIAIIMHYLIIHI